MDAIRVAALTTARSITPLLADDRVAARWHEPSALSRMSVGGLAGHLARALDTIETYLTEPEPPDGGLLRPGEYFATALSMAGDLDGPMHTGVRERGEAAGAVGPAVLVEQFGAQVDRVAALLESEPETRRVTVLRGQARMLLDEYLPTRIVEMVVHADDLAVSVGADTPDLGAAAGMAIDVLVETARLARGDVAVLRALARRERDAVDALRVL
jgi:hypothetical protein